MYGDKSPVKSYSWLNIIIKNDTGKGAPMNSPQLQVLQGLCDDVANLQERLERRAGQHDCNADGYADAQVLKVLQPLHAGLTAYRDFHAAQERGQGRIPQGQRVPFFDVIARADDARLKLFTLCNSTMQRTTSAPGSARRLSPLFKRIVAAEQQDLCQIQDRLQEVIRQDLDRVKTMPRHLRIAHSQA